MLMTIETVEIKRFKKILSELNSIKAKSDSFSTDNIEEIVSKAIESKTLDQANMFDSFENYFNEIRRVLLEQAYTSDKKPQYSSTKVLHTQKAE